MENSINLKYMSSNTSRTLYKLPMFVLYTGLFIYATRLFTCLWEIACLTVQLW